MFHSFYKLKLPVAKLFLSQKSAKILFYHMSTSPLPSSVWYLQWRVQLSPLCSTVFFLNYKLKFCLYWITVLEAGTVYVIFSTQVWPENQVPRVLGEVEHQEILFDVFTTKKSEFQCFKLFIA